MSDSLQRYRDFQPTGFDPKGLAGERHGISEWFVVPVSRTRDSGPLEESNFAAALAELGGESEDCQVHRFGHWGPGWYEIILVSPEREDLVSTAEGIAARLESYPVLDEEDLSERALAESLAIIKDCGSRWVRDGTPEGWPGKVYRKLGNLGIEPRENAARESDIKAAIYTLGFGIPRYLTVRRMLRSWRHAGGWAPAQWANLRVRVRNPEYPD